MYAKSARALSVQPISGSAEDWMAIYPDLRGGKTRHSALRRPGQLRGPKRAAILVAGARLVQSSGRNGGIKIPVEAAARDSRKADLQC